MELGFVRLHIFAASVVVQVEVDFDLLARVKSVLLERYLPSERIGSEAENSSDLARNELL